MSDDPTFLGTVQDVDGATVRVELDLATPTGLAFIDGHGYRIGQVGSFVRIPMGYLDLFGIVSRVGAGAAPEPLVTLEHRGYRWILVQMIGEGQRRGDFRRGVSQHPTVGDHVHLVTEQDLERIYGRPDAPNYVQVGTLASADAVPALINVDKLVTRHSAVLGATGTGKSTTVAGLLMALSDSHRYPSARVLVFDIHGEYAAALRDRATVFRLNPNKKKLERPLHVPYWAMSFDELLPLTFGALDDSSAGAIIDKITAMKRASIREKSRPGITESNLTVDSPVPFSIQQLWFDLNRLVNATHTVQGTGQSENTEALFLNSDGSVAERGDAARIVPPRYRTQSQAAGQDKVYLSASALNIRRQLEALASRLRDPRFDFLFRPGPWHPNLSGIPTSDLDDLLRSWIGDEKPIAILDLSGVPNSVLTDLIGVMLRIVYDSLFWARDLSEGGRERPILLVLEEAHAYLGPSDSGPAATSVRRIVKEGRKYGIGAMVVSQRPAEIDSTILSQCGTIFAMRLSNTIDRGHVTGGAPDNLEGLFGMLPILRTGEAIIVGEAVHLPVRTIVSLPPKGNRPDSEDPQVVVDVDISKGPAAPGGWNRGREFSDYSEVVSVWRSQNPRSPRTHSAESDKGD